MPAVYNDYARRSFVQHIVKLLNDDPDGYGYQLVELREGPVDTTLEFRSERPLVFSYTPPDRTTPIVYGTRKLVVTVEATYERKEG